MRLIDWLLLRRHAIVELVIDQLKNILQIEHCRHRSWANIGRGVAFGKSIVG